MPLVKTAVYQEVKYIVIGTATSSSVVIAGNVTTLRGPAADRPLDAAARPPGCASMSSVSGLPIARNSGATRTRSTVWVARA